jgi:hypothetical protein
MVCGAAGVTVVGGCVVGASEEAVGVSAGRPADPEKRIPLRGAFEGTSIVPPALKVKIYDHILY